MAQRVARALEELHASDLEGAWMAADTTTRRVCRNTLSEIIELQFSETTIRDEGDGSGVLLTVPRTPETAKRDQEEPSCLWRFGPSSSQRTF
jgi:hypothetical protein